MSRNCLLFFIAFLCLLGVQVEGQVVPVWLDDFDTMSVYSPQHYNTYGTWNIMGLGEEAEGNYLNEDNSGGGVTYMGWGGGEDQGLQAGFMGGFMGGENKKQRAPVSLPMQFVQVQDEPKAERQAPDEIEREYLQQTVVRPKVVTQPVIVKRMETQPITRIHHVTQPVVRRIVRQKVIRPHVITRTEIRPHIKEQPIIVPRYFDQQEKHEQYRVEHVEGTPITLSPTFSSEKVRGQPTYGTLSPQYMAEQPQQQYYQAYQAAPSKQGYQGSFQAHGW